MGPRKKPPLGGFFLGAMGSAAFGTRKSKHPSSRELGCFEGEPGDDLLSHGNPHYHRRGVVSRSCSGWEGVVPTRYGHQAMTCCVADAVVNIANMECSWGCA